MKSLFDENLYPSLGRIGKGQYAQIHRCNQPVEGELVGAILEYDGHYKFQAL